MSSIDEIKARIDILDLVAETVTLRRSGKSYTGFCPFHANTRTPAFVVFPESGTWRCFGQCAEGGDVFKFLMKRDGLDFKEALQTLAARAGVELHAPSPAEAAAAEAHDELRLLLEDAALFYIHQLRHTSAGAAALEYLHTKRHLTDETIEAFGLGYAPQTWDMLASHFRGKGVSEADLLAAGLVSEREGGGVYDRFRHRVMFPIRDDKGRMAGFGARILNPEDVPKFLNSPQTPVFDKGRLLYGLDRAKRAIQTTDQAVIVEGYLDVIALHQAGFTNVVSPMGTALTETQLHLLNRLSHHIVLALDPDAAGDKATLRGLQVARQTLERETELVFDSRGLLHNEARLNADIRVTALPEGLDPDEVVLANPDDWVRILAEARPVVLHVMETLAKGRDLNDAKVKREIADQVLVLIEDVPDAIERDSYRQDLARFLRLDERLLATRTPPPERGRIHRPRPLPTQQRAVEALRRPPPSNYSLEVHILGILLRNPELLPRIDRALLQQSLVRLSEADFQQSLHQEIFALFLNSIEQDIAEPLRYVQNELTEEMFAKADEVLEKTNRVLDPNKDRVLEDLVRALIDLRLRTMRENIEHLRILMDELHQTGEWKPSELMHSMKNYTLSMKTLDRARERFTTHALTLH